jgi:hypothetical protein
MEDQRPHIYVHDDSSADGARTFYEIPDEVAERVRSIDPDRTFVECLNAVLGLATLA